MDRALWITWYDLPQDGRATYLSWLHETHIPALLQRPDFAWAAHYQAVPKGSIRTIRRDDAVDDVDDPALPAGSGYILLVGARHAGAFGDPGPAALIASLPQQAREKLSMRIGERTNVMVEAARVEKRGRQSDNADIGLAPCIQLGSFNYPWQHEQEMLAWFTQWRMPAIVEQPGCIRVRKLASVSGWAKHAILYEWLSVEARNRDYLTHEDANPDMKAWSDRVVGRTNHAPGSATVAFRLWPKVRD